MRRADRHRCAGPTWGAAALALLVAAAAAGVPSGAGASVAAGAGSGPAVTAQVTPTTTPPLPGPPTSQQVIERGQGVAAGRTVIAAGHVDLGPRFDRDGWRLMVHDDTGETSVWRPLDDVVLRLGDAAVATVPEDPAYGFLGAPPGSAVHVISQTEVPGVAWLGWNTQDPSVADRVDRGVTLRLLGVQGPGRVAVYLQPGNFGPPDVLWRSDVAEPQPVWVELGSHTHGNWVFTAPGAYLLRIEAVADLVDGEVARAEGLLRVAVGGATDPGAVHDARWEGSTASPPASGDAGTGSPADRAAPAGGEPDRGPVVLVVAAVASAGAALALAAARRERRLRRAARAAAAGAGYTTSGDRR